MGIDGKTIMKVAITTTGVALAGPAGALVGNLIGSLGAGLLPGVAELISGISANLAITSVKEISRGLVERLEPSERQMINHDLQTAFRDAFREALYDVGGRSCFPVLPASPARDVPNEVLFFNSTGGALLWRNHDPLSDQICVLFRDMERALTENRILPLEPPPALESASVYSHLPADAPHDLERAFYDQNLVPFMTKYRSLLVEVPGLESHLHRYLYERTLVHLGELLKHRTPAWRAYNRLVLQSLEKGVRELGEGQQAILEKLETITNSPQGEGLEQWSDGMADLLTAAGRIEQKMTMSFDALTEQILSQHGEMIEQFNLLVLSSNRLESKVDRVLTFLNDGRYTIEGAPRFPLHLPPSPGKAPYKGLQSFSEEDSGFFYGREELIARLAARIPQRHFLALIGASGSGKSSLVHAGLIPMLKGHQSLPEQPVLPVGSTGWKIVSITPTDHPLRSLAIAFSHPDQPLHAVKTMTAELAASSTTLDLMARRLAGKKNTGRILLVVDQFEELFTLCHDPIERRAFVDNLLESASPGRPGWFSLLIVLRADFYAECAQFDELRLAVAQNQEFIGPMTETELRRAIELPAQQTDWQFEPGLVELLVHDVSGEPGALPLLSHALLETWRRRSGRVMTLESYAESGGVRGAIAKSAEYVFTQRLDENQQNIARNIFLRLTHLAENAQETRRRAALDELAPERGQKADMENVLNLLAESRLVTIEEGFVQVAHEALIREWPRLRGWLEENRAGLVIHRRLTEAAREWNAIGREESILFRGVRLDETLELATQNEGILSEQERTFLDASFALRQREMDERERTRQRQLEDAQKLAEAERARAEQQASFARRFKRRTSYLAAALMVAAILAGLTGILAVVSNRSERKARDNAATAQTASTLAVAQQQTAQAESQRASREESRAVTNELIALSQQARLENRPQRSLLLALEAFQRLFGSADPQNLHVMNALWQTVSSTGGEVVAFHNHIIGLITLSPDGRWLTVTSYDGVLALWDLQAPNVLATGRILLQNNDILTALAFSPDERWLIAAGYQDTLYLWDMSSGKPPDAPRELKAHSNGITSLYIGSDSQYLFTGGMDGNLRIWDLSDQDPAADVSVMPVGEHTVNGVLLSPDARWLVALSGTNEVRLWDLHSPSPLETSFTLPTPFSLLPSVKISPDSHWLVTAGNSPDVLLWDLSSQNPAENPLHLTGHDAVVNSVAFSPDNRWLVTGSSDWTARRWDLNAADPSQTSLALRGHSQPVLTLAVSPDGHWLVTGSSDHTARIWDMNLPDPNQAPVVLNGHDGSVNSVLVDPKNRWVITASEDQTARRWPITQKNQSLQPYLLAGHQGAVNALNFTSQKKTLASIGFSDIFLWDMTSDNFARSLLFNSDQSDRQLVTASSSDGRWLAAAGMETSIRLWEVDKPNFKETPILLKGHSGRVFKLFFSPDNRYLVSGGEEGQIWLWDLSSEKPEEKKVSISAGSSGANFLAISPDDRWLAATSWVEGLKVWDLQNSESTQPVLQISTCIGPLAFSPDGNWLAAGCTFAKVQLWKMPELSAQPVTLIGHSIFINSLVFDPASQWLATTGQDTAIRVWNLSNSDPSANPTLLLGHTQAVFALEVSRDGRWLASASNDQTARLWDMQSSEPSQNVLMFQTHGILVNSLAFSPDGHWLATGHSDGSIRLWTLRIEELVQTACRLAGRNFFTAEWAQYFKGQEYRQTCP